MLSDVFFPRVNGVSTSIQTYRSDLQALGHQVTLVAPQYPSAIVAATAATDPIDTVRIESRGVPRDPEDRLLKWGPLMRWAESLRPDDVDVIHIQTPFVAHYAGLRLARRLGCPVVETYHTYFEHYLHHYVPGIPAALTRSLARRMTVSQCGAVQAVISPSRQMADALRDYGVKTPIEVLPTGLPPAAFGAGNGAAFRAQFGIPAQRPVITFVGRVAHEKNIDFLLQMLVELRRRVPDVLMVIAGEGPAEQHLRALAARLGLEPNVLFIGYLERTRGLLDCYRAADAFVFASRTETQGLVLLEAMAQGTPVVSTAVMGTVDVLSGAGGAVVVPEEVGPFADAVAGVLRDPRHRDELSGRARDDAARWASRVMAERLVRLYEGVIHTDAPPRSVPAA